jgi:cytoskeletal protein RodZ
MEKGALDGLKIARSQERDSGLGRWLFLVVAAAVVIFLAAWWWLGGSQEPEVRTATSWCPCTF